MSAVLGGRPVLVLSEGTTRVLGRDAQRMNILAARVIAEAVRTTLGPKGMDKMLVDTLGDIVVTNDGVTILKEMEVEHPAAKMMVEVAKTQDDLVGDGTTTAVVIAGELLKEAEKLLDQAIHPTIIATGFRMAAEKAQEVLNTIAVPVSIEDEKMLKRIATTAMTGKVLNTIAMPVSIEDEKMLKRIATTAMTGKKAESGREVLADLVVKAVRQIADKTDGGYKVDIDYIGVEKKAGGSISDSELVHGVILDKERVHPGMPKRVKNAKIALIDAPLEIKKTETDAEIRITTPEQLRAFIEEEEMILKQMVDKIISVGANVVICQKGIDDIAQHYLAKAGIYAVRRAKKSDMEKLARATGGRIVTNIDDLTPEDLGSAGLVEEVKIGEDKMTFVRDCKNPRAMGILIRGGSEHVVDEVERAVHDAICVVAAAIEDGKIVYGGGAPEMEVAKHLRDYSQKVGGKEALAIGAFADALEIIPKTLAENAGLDAIDIIVELKLT
ncbi:MAG: thermosome subunit beta [Candidatus Hadarchaeales archaeon]